MIRQIVEFMRRMTRNEFSTFQDVRAAFRTRGAASVVTSSIAYIHGEIRHWKWKGAELRDNTEKPLSICLIFLASNFESYDGELWAIDSLANNLLPTIFELEDVLPHLSDLPFTSFQSILWRVIALSRCERTFQAVSSNLVPMWITNRTERGSCYRQLFENEFNKQALIRRLRQVHRNGFRLVCTNVSLPHCAALCMVNNKILARVRSGEHDSRRSSQEMCDM